MRGVVEAPVLTERIDFNTVDELSPLVRFLSGLARYYRGSGSEGAAAKSWLEDSISELTVFVDDPASAGDRDALAQAHLYMARAGVRLADVDPERRSSWLAQAAEHGAMAADLNPYAVEAPTLLAVIDVRRQAPVAQIRVSLVEAVRLDPGDSTARLNLAVFDGATGKIDDAVRQLDQAAETRRLIKQPAMPEIEEFKRQLEFLR
jgi:hypothetical protein